MKVIVAGMSKTGTKTMYAALNRLGYEVYDFMENFHYLGDDWVRIIKEGARVADFRRMYKNVDAVTDLPGYFYWEEILEAFPDAKVILMNRDENSWYNSVLKQSATLSNDLLFIALMCFSYSGLKLFKYRSATFGLFSCRGKWPWSTIRMYDEEALKRMYRNHNREVLQNAPKDQLLVYEVKQGWKPLCDFLGVEVPDREFPFKNKGASVMDDLRREDKIMQDLMTELKWSLVVLLVLFGMVLFMLFNSGWYANLFG